MNLTTQHLEIIRCDTVTALTETDEPAQLSYEALKQRQTTYDQQHHNIAYRCKLTPRGREIVQRNHYANMQLECIDGQDYLFGGYNQDEYDYMIQYLLSLGTNVQILSPKSLQTGYLAAIDKIRDMYRWKGATHHYIWLGKHHHLGQQYESLILARGHFLIHLINVALQL